MFRIVIITSLLLIVIKGESFSEDLEGTFRCKAVHVEMTRMEEGRPLKFSGYEGGIKEGSTVFFHYNASTLINSVSVRESSSELKLFGYASGYFRKPSLVEGYYSTKNNSIGLGEDYFHVDFTKGELSLNRYYKNDWHGFYIRENSSDVLVVGYDCRHPKDRFDQIIEHLNKEGFGKE